ncbi:hypothetical protein K1T71_009497 [Dendrolimus kikuchii]|uniref:Uncharacterized protein n=1 Tax=Dendrolimus kikuchii TaxID=765133 RepID=A0ACC1CUV7_9NEOP|nr:hypothetical protein K1T71_009497 [Dendrolimus kikuchii]
MLSTISQIYDPLGLLAPTIIIAKNLLQKLWLSKIDWDDPIPHSVLLKWHSFISKLGILQNVRIPRYVRHENAKTTELHIFSDASQDAYGACAYIRSYVDDNTIATILLCAKSKVAPVKPVSIPRLELCGALLGARLYAKIIKSMRLTFDKIYFWTDSTIVLGWLRMSPSLLKTFVQNRVVEINELTGDLSWFHVSGKQNPADMLSRGVQLDVLQSSDVWWRGPAFLRESNYNWAHNSNSDVNNIELPELKTFKTTLVSQIHTDFIQFERFSSYNRLVRAIAYSLRFIHNCRSKIKTQNLTGAISLDEKNNALKLLTRISQEQSFPDIYQSLVNEKPFKCSRDISSLNVFLDNNKLIRVGGRLANSEVFNFDKKHPLLLNAKHLFTRLLFQHHHHNLLHAGPQSLLAAIRECWWPLKGRNLAKQTVYNCVRCMRLKAKNIQPQMGNLPRERLESVYPFYRCGLDYGGPLLILNRKGRGAKLEKCYICLFVCFSTRAIHLDLVTSLSSESYILALKRFISRRGKPAEIFSDNGRTFVGALKQFSKFLLDKHDDLINFTADNSIKLTFIPPYSPHWGGLWEAGIKSCKFHLRRVVGNANLTYEEMSTVLTQVEAILNSRPMYPMSPDPNDLLPLTPGHFLIGRPLTAPVHQDLTSAVTQHLTRYDRVEQMRQHFWTRWSKEYISELQRRVKWQKNVNTLTPDTLVLIKEENLPPLKWRLGRVLQTFTGKDGISRVADVKTAAGIIQRSFSKICPLLQLDEIHQSVPHQL